MVSNSLGMIPLDSLNLRLLWPKLPTLTRLYAVILCGGSLYVVYALSRTVGKLWTLRRTSEQGSTSDRLSQVFSALCARLDNVRQVIILLWLLFGASFLLELALSPQTADSSRLSLLEIVLIGVLAQAGFGCLVFSICCCSMWRNGWCLCGFSRLRVSISPLDDPQSPR
jgi:hypothetical protein